MVRVGVVSFRFSYSVAWVSMATSGISPSSRTMRTSYWKGYCEGLHFSVGMVQAIVGAWMSRLATLSWPRASSGSTPTMGWGVMKVGGWAR